MLGAVHVAVLPLLEPPLEEPPLDDPPLEEPPLDDPPLEEPPLEDPPELDVVSSPPVSSVGSVDAGALVGSGALTVSTEQATRMDPTAINETGRSRRMKHSLERGSRRPRPTKLDLHPFKPTANFSG
jgi:hypothetical protein